MNKKECKKIVDDLKRIRGLERKAFFEAEGELSRWRGLGSVQKNKKRFTRKTKHKGKIHKNH